MKRWFTIVLLATFTGCGKPVPAKPDQSSAPAIATAVEPTAVNQQSAAERTPAVKASMDEADQIASLINPAKLATLKSRGANPRILKITAILITAKNSGKSPAEITLEAVEKIGWGRTDKGSLTAAAILRNLTIAEELGSTTPEDLIEMKKGQSPVVRKGPSTGDIVSVDHIIPVASVPELSNVIANLELLPLKLNQSKGDSIGPRQRDLAKKLHAAGLLPNPKLPD
jgi:hypothetical protein